MKKERLYLKEIKGGIRNKNIDMLANVIYHNFKFLDNQNIIIHNKEYINALLRNENSYILFVYDNNNKIIGYLIGGITIKNNVVIFYLSYIYVSPKYRNNGVGNKMMKTLLKYVKYSDITNVMTIIDTRNHNVVKFFNSYKFVRDLNNSTGEQYDIFINHNHYKDL